MSGRVNVRYGLNQGDRLMVTRGKEKKKATVVKEYPFHSLVDWGKDTRNFHHSIGRCCCVTYSR